MSCSDCTVGAGCIMAHLRCVVIWGETVRYARPSIIPGVVAWPVDAHCPTVKPTEPGSEENLGSLVDNPHPHTHTTLGPHPPYLPPPPSPAPEADEHFPKCLTAYQGLRKLLLPARTRRGEGWRGGCGGEQAVHYRCE